MSVWMAGVLDCLRYVCILSIHDSIIIVIGVSQQEVTVTML